MNYVEEKLENFTRTVMMEATEKRKKILQQAEEYKERVLEKKELEFLEQAYETIQKEIRKVQKEKHEMISRAIIERKRALFQKREEIVEEVFDNLARKINAFQQTDEYKQYLLKSIEEGMMTVGEGEIIVYLNHSDIHFADTFKEKLGKKFGKSITIKEEQYDMIGGCRVLNKTKNILVDLSFKSKIQHQKDQFLKTSGLVIE